MEPKAKQLKRKEARARIMEILIAKYPINAEIIPKFKQKMIIAKW